MKKTPDPIDVYIGGQVRMRRLMLGMSQGKLAEALGVSFQQVQKNEKGTNRIGSSRLHQIAEVLGVSVPFFFEGLPGHSSADPHDPSADFTQQLVSAGGLELAKGFQRIRNGALRGSIVAPVEELANAQQGSVVHVGKTRMRWRARRRRK
jgi:transcriptional regulator with XRE-family HTH domain